MDIERMSRARAHLKHAVHVCDAGCVEAQRLVERGRALPSHNGAHRGRYLGREAGGRGGRWRCMQRARKTKLDTGHARERTMNM